MTTTTDREAACEWAQKMLADPRAVVLDVETTGLYNAEIVQIGVIDMRGEILLDRLVKPSRPIPADATAIHGIADHRVRFSPTFAQLLPELTEAVHGKTIVTYNVEFDKRMIREELFAMEHPVNAWVNACGWDCAQIQYSRFVGRRAQDGDRVTPCGYKSLKLPSAGHQAIDDCRAALQVIRTMAGGK